MAAATVAWLRTLGDSQPAGLTSASFPDTKTLLQLTAEALRHPGRGTFGGGGTFTSSKPRIADDMGAFKALPPTRLPDADVSGLQDLLQPDPLATGPWKNLRSGLLLADRARILFHDHRETLYAVATTNGWVCDALDPQHIVDCNGFVGRRPRGYQFYEYDNGLSRDRARLVLFGLVPDRVLRVDVVVRCHAHTALTRNGGFYYSQKGALVKQIDGLLFHLRTGRSKRNSFGSWRCSRANRAGTAPS